MNVLRNKAHLPIGKQDYLTQSNDSKSNIAAVSMHIYAATLFMRDNNGHHLSFVLLLLELNQTRKFVENCVSRRS